MKKGTFIALSMALCVIMAGCNGTNTSSVDNKDTQISATDNNKKTAAPEVEMATPVVETPTPEEDTLYNIGDTAELKDWEISVTNMKIVKSIQADYGVFSPEEDNKYVRVYAKIKNIGKEAGKFCPSYGYGDDVNVKVLYGDGYEFIATNLLGYKKDLHNETINPLSSKKGELAFEIPNTVANSEDELFIQFNSGDDLVKFKIR